MQKPLSYKNNNQRSDIRFIRAVAAPSKNFHQSKPHTETHIFNGLTRNNAQRTRSIVITLSFEGGPPTNLIYSYTDQSKVMDLLSFLKDKLKEDGLYFKSGNIHLDYFLTLTHRYVKELTVTKLRLDGNRIKIPHGVNLEAIEIIKCVGSGGFSKVFLGRVYGIMMAIKMVDKEFIIKTAKQAIIENERLILQACSDHPFVTKLYLAFETQHYVVFAMEYCNGGELFNLLRKVKKMKEADAKFYFLETLSAL